MSWKRKQKIIINSYSVFNNNSGARIISLTKCQYIMLCRLLLHNVFFLPTLGVPRIIIKTTTAVYNINIFFFYFLPFLWIIQTDDGLMFVFFLFHCLLEVDIFFNGKHTACFTLIHIRSARHSATPNKTRNIPIQVPGIIHILVWRQQQ